jgi:internalin A
MPTYRGKRFTDASLLGLAKIETIRQLALYDTAVTDDGLVAFAARAKRLTGFHMSSSSVTDRGVCEILKSCPIANLQLHDAIGVTDAVGPLIASHPEIRELYLNGTSIGNKTAKAIEAMPNIWSFCAKGSRISDAGLASLGQMPKLSLVSLNSTLVKGHGLRHLSNLEGLHIYLDDCKICDEGTASSLSQMTRMRLLSLEKNDVTDEGLEGIGACRRLEDLRLNDTGITDRTLDRIADLPNLEALRVSGTGVTRDRVARLMAASNEIRIGSDFADEL